MHNATAKKSSLEIEKSPAEEDKVFPAIVGKELLVDEEMIALPASSQ